MLCNTTQRFFFFSSHLSLPPLSFSSLHLYFPRRIHLPPLLSSFPYVLLTLFNSLRLPFLSFFSLPLTLRPPSIIPFLLYTFHCIPFWQRTITLADRLWVLAAFMATCHLCRRYLKQHVYWYCNKTKAINRSHIGPHLLLSQSVWNLSLHPQLSLPPPAPRFIS